ncbi:armadillo-type protein [Pisolithus microcarpus]|nr:armadillo-type protein [Pisolithus microcarpus]
MELKAGAVMKLTYLNMLGYDMNWASFHIIEGMSSSKIHLKLVFRRRYRCTHAYHQSDTEGGPAEVAITLNALSSVVTPGLARDLGPEVFIVLNHSRPHIRRRAVLTLYRERLHDPDPGNPLQAVGLHAIFRIISPRPPHLFHLLTTSSNNWMLIKLIKLVCVLFVTSPSAHLTGAFGSLSPHEPRLVKKLQPPITVLISTTTAISLLYECVHTCIIGSTLRGPSGLSLAQTCVSKLAAFLQDADQNRQCCTIPLLGSSLIGNHEDVILASVDDDDISIRMRALELVTALVNKHNLQSIVQQLLSHLMQPQTSIPSAIQSLSQHVVPSIPLKAPSTPSHSPAYRLMLSQRIISMCSDSMYDNVTDFEWYLSVLVDLTYVSGVDISAQIRDQLVDAVGVILDRNSGDALSVIPTPSRSVETMTTMSKSTTTDFDSSGPPDTSSLMTALETLCSSVTTTSNTLNSTTSFKTAASNHDKDKSVSGGGGSSALRPTPINLPPPFKKSVRRAVQRRLRRYARELDPHTSEEVELGLLDAIDLAVRILERSHRPQNMVPFVGIVAASHSPVTASTTTRLRPTTLSSMLCNVANHAVQGSLKAIRLSGKHLLTVLNPPAVAKSTLMPHTYEMARLEVPIPQGQSPLIPGE